MRHAGLPAFLTFPRKGGRDQRRKGVHESADPRRKGVQKMAPLAFLVVLLSGCVTVRSEPPRFSGTWPPLETGPRPAVALTVTGGAMLDGYPSDLGPILDRWGVETERAYRESALFSDVSLEGGRSDLRAAVELRATQTQYPALAAFAYLTLFIIPNVEVTEIAVATRITTVQGEPLGTVEVHGKSRTWYQILLLPFSPFFEPKNVTPGIVYDLNREAISTLHARGVF